MELHEQIRRFIAERFLFDPSAAIDPAQSLMKAGVLDSTGAMELVFFLEDALSIKVDDADIVPANLDSINNLAAFVERKRTGRAA
jgi:acyl carrier protein